MSSFLSEFKFMSHHGPRLVLFLTSICLWVACYTFNRKAIDELKANNLYELKKHIKQLRNVIWGLYAVYLLEFFMNVYKPFHGMITGNTSVAVVGLVLSTILVVCLNHIFNICTDDNCNMETTKHSLERVNILITVLAVVEVGTAVIGVTNSMNPKIGFTAEIMELLKTPRTIIHFQKIMSNINNVNSKKLSKVVLTTDQEELIEHLECFLNDNRCYFGVYGPAGSGKSFSICHFIEKYGLQERVLLSGTTNNACRVLEKTLETHNNINVYSFIESLNKFVSDIKTNTDLNTTNTIGSTFETIEHIYFVNLMKFIKELQNKVISKFHENNSVERLDDGQLSQPNDDKENLKYLTKENVIEIENEIIGYINSCPKELLCKLHIKCVNYSLMNIFHQNKFIKTIHSLLQFEQSRDENHNVVFLPSKSNIIKEKHEDPTNVKYGFTPKLTGKKKSMYNDMNNEDKKDFEKQYYKYCFSKLTDINLLIIDESSMMKEMEFRYIIYICKILKVKIIFLGDKFQLPPIEDNLKENVEHKSSNYSFNVNTTTNVDTIDYIDYSPAVKLKNSYTLNTIKRTSNPVLQDIYKTFRDLVEKTGEGKVKLQNIQFTKNIQPTDKYLIKNKNDISNVIKYIQMNDINLENTRILCFSNNEVNKMNTLVRHELYGNINDKYVQNETLLITNYMILPNLEIKHLIIIEKVLESGNKQHFNYIFNLLIDNINNSKNHSSMLYKNQELSYITNTFKDINKEKIRLHTSCNIKVIKVIETSVYVKEKIINVNVIFFSYEGKISLFFSFNNKDKEYIHNLLKTEKQLIKLSTDLYRMHDCNEKCNNNTHSCSECDPETCIHHIEICDKENCTFVCNSCYECDSNCSECLKKHRNNYSTNLWNKFICKQHLLEPDINYSYATTVHKSQGQSIDNIIVSEYNIANCILFNNEITECQKMLIYPTCMYTAVTRAKNILVRLK